MNFHISNSKLACVAAVLLTGLAMLVVFVFHPGGFETQDSWFLALLPAGLAVYPLSDVVYRVAPHAEPIVFWISMIAINFLWYWILCFILIKLYRFMTDR